MSFDRNSREFNDTRLDTWKAIAQYLGRSSRTAQRWHSEYGLPVHHLGGDASSVFAYADELELWLRQRDRAISENKVRSGHVSDAGMLVAVKKRQLQSLAPSDIESIQGTEREAADLVTRAQRLWESLSAANLSVIARIYRKAIDLDASNARAFAGLAQALIAQAVLGNLHPSAALLPAEAALERALEIDAGLFEAQCAFAMLKLLLFRDWDGARKLLDEALLHRPEAGQALVGRALLAIGQGSLSEASDFLRRASIERPLNSSVAELLCWVEYLSGSVESALGLIAEARETGHSGAILDTVEALSSVLVTGPLAQVDHLESMTASTSHNHALFGVLGFAYGRIGQMDAAREALDSMTRLGLAGTFDFAYPIALTYWGMGNRPEAVKWLEQSYKHGSLWSLGFKTDPILADLREDDAFHAFFELHRYPETDLSINNKEDRESEMPSMPYIA